MIAALIAVAVLAALFILVAAVQPAEFRVARQTTIAAPPVDVFAQVNDLRKFQEWSPWARLDPEVRMTYSGPSAGQGAAFSWEGNSKVGAGAMTITSSQTGERVEFRLEFLRPFKATNTTVFTLKSDNGKTAVTWRMTGRKNFIFRALGPLMNLDKMIGRDFEKGLANLKALVEPATCA